MLLADGIISSDDSKTVISTLDDKMKINGQPIPSHLCGKYEHVIDKLNIDGQLVIEVSDLHEPNLVTYSGPF